jgi:hypothetical protein
VNTGSLNAIFYAGDSVRVYTNSSAAPGTAASERMRIDSSGNVGIGTSSPNAKLNVYSASSTANLTQWNGGTSDTNFITIAKSGTLGATGGTPQFSLGMDYSTTYVDLCAIKFARDGGAGGNMQFFTGVNANGSERMRIDSSGNVIAGGSAALATTATNGFLYVPTCAGTPTGTPTAVTGMAPIVVNTTNNKLYFYSGGAWRDAGP